MKNLNVVEFKTADFLAALKNLNAKLAKKNVPLITCNVVREFNRDFTDEQTGTKYSIPYVEYAVTTPFDDFQVVEGTKYLGLVKENEFGSVSIVPTTDYSIQHHADDRHCDHCGQHRNRKLVYVFEKDGKELVIGSTCVDDYFKIDIESVLSLAAFKNEIEAYGAEDEYGFYGRPAYVNFDYALTVAAYVLKKDGGYKREETANAISYILYPPKECNGGPGYAEREATRIEINAFVDADAGLIEEVKAYWTNLNCKSDFEFNVQQRFTHNDPTSLALIACGVWTVLKARFERAVNKDAVNNNHFGEIGKRVKNVPITLVHTSGYQSAYGDGTLCTFKTANGEVLKWFTTSDIGFDLNETLPADFTVKSHGEYRGRKETIINRVKA